MKQKRSRKFHKEGADRFAKQSGQAEQSTEASDWPAERYGDKDPGHAQALEEAKNRLDKATKDVINKCNCELKAEGAAVAAATVALAARIADALSQVCAEDPELCYAW